MSKLGESVLCGAEEALAYAKGQRKGFKLHKVKIPEQIDVRAVRDKLNLTRREFSDQFGFNIRTLEKWEQGVRKPDGAARAFLVVIDKNPKAVATALGGD